MSNAPKLSPHKIRARFAAAMTRMYRKELPAFDALENMVRQSNDAADTHTDSQLLPTLNSNETRHGAIRVGSAEELQILRRIFAVMGMQAVGYYDLSMAGLPVHSTAFRAIETEDLKTSPFRLFTSLLRLEFISDEGLRDEIKDILSKRKIVTPEALDLLETAETNGGLDSAEADEFISAILETFRWHGRSDLSRTLYDRLADQNKLVADIVAFPGPHINHLTEASKDIAAAQGLIPSIGATPKDVIEGPPHRKCPILLRQTAFKAISEAVHFLGDDQHGEHTARFGEIEARGCALTRRGRAVYDDMLEQAMGKTDVPYEDRLAQEFSQFPDDWDELRQKDLAYFTFRLTEKGLSSTQATAQPQDFEQLIEDGFIEAIPIIYEDFLPVSAAGIFRSNLGDEDNNVASSSSNQSAFEASLGATVLDPFAIYSAQSEKSKADCLERLSSTFH